MTIETLTLGENRFFTNCYLLHQGQKCLVVDPGFQPEVVLSALEQRGLFLEAILLTHGHFDHVGGVGALVDATGCRVFLHPEDLTLPKALTAGPLTYTDEFSDNQTLTLADMTFRVLHTPGHTRGSVCLLFPQALISGDTLFAGSCGRTDLPGGSRYQLINSLARLAGLPGDYAVYPGHGPATTLAEERAFNPYLSRIP